MRQSISRLAVPALAVTMLAAGCGGTASPTPEPTPPAEAKALLRITQVQALPPIAKFGSRPPVVITLDGKYLAGGPIPAIFPGPLVSPLIERQITPAGWAKIVAAARAAGLLSGQVDFTGGQMPPGSGATRLEIVAGGRLYDLTGDSSRRMVCITTPCDPQPGTPEAFGGFVNALIDISSMLGPEIGRDSVYTPAGFAIVVGPPPDQQGLEQPPIAWPIADGFAAFGKPLADGSGRRCGTVAGEALGALRPAIAAANQLTRWRDPVDGSFHGLIVQPLLPGDGDPCEGLV